MTYGVFFLLLAGGLGMYAVATGGWYLVLLWPALSLMIVASGYLGLGPRVFGKRSDGTLPLLSCLLLFPFLAGLWIVWRVAVLISREPKLHELIPNVLIGRRLLSHELPPDVDVVVDLTCEFVEPRAVRSVSTYLSFPILDDTSCDPRLLVEFVRTLASQEGQMFIHCAQGHGRTGLVATTLLLAAGHASSVEEAVHLLKSARPLARLNANQMEALRRVAAASS